MAEIRPFNCTANSGRSILALQMTRSRLLDARRLARKSIQRRRAPHQLGPGLRIAEDHQARRRHVQIHRLGIGLVIDPGHHRQPVVGHGRGLPQQARRLSGVDRSIQPGIAPGDGGGAGRGRECRRAHPPLFEALLEGTREDRDNKRCLLINTLLEAPADEPELGQRTGEALAYVEGRFAAVLEAGRADGSIRTTTPPVRQARLLMTGIFGLRVYARMPGGRDHVREIVDDLLQTVLQTG